MDAAKGKSKGKVSKGGKGGKDGKDGKGKRKGNEHPSIERRREHLISQGREVKARLLGSAFWHHSGFFNAISAGWQLFVR